MPEDYSELQRVIRALLGKDDLAKAAGVNSVEPLARWFHANPLPPPTPVAPSDGLLPRKSVHGGNLDYLPSLSALGLKENPEGLEHWPLSTHVEDRRNIYLSPTGNKYFQFMKDK